MKKLLAIFLTLLSLNLHSQSIIEYDYMESSSTTYLSAGWWTPAATAGWFTNASVSPTTSAVIYGIGNGTSLIEQDWYSMPTVTLDPSKSYQLRFKLASYTFSNATAATRGLDAADYMSVQVSSNGGAYVTEMRVVGNSNATWAFTNTASVTHTANGSFTSSASPAGDVYFASAGASTLTPSTYILNLAPNLSSVAIDFYCRVNSAGEEWWIDNIELWDLTPIGLPIELVSFDGENIENTNLLKWSTASEMSSDYFIIERSTTGEENNYKLIGSTGAAGNSNQLINYSFQDRTYTNTINYYRLKQYDIDGVYKIYGPISIDNRNENKRIIKFVNLLGQEVDENYNGSVIIFYSDGTSEKIIK
jgi:hypothetical protein